MDLLWTDFLNTDYHDWRGGGLDEDRLANPRLLRQYLNRWKLDAAVPPSPEEMERLRECRSRIRRMAEGSAQGKPLSPDELSLLNRLMAGGYAVRALTATDEEQPRYKLGAMPAGSGWDQVLAEIAASFASTLAEGDPFRIRICTNPDCLWVFYDDTRSRTKRYCDDQMCGNLLKVRRFRAKRKQEDV